MATKLISVKYKIKMSSGLIGDSSTTGQATWFFFKTLPEMKNFLNKCISASSTGTTNKFFLYRVECVWNDDTKAITSTDISMDAEDL